MSRLLSAGYHVEPLFNPAHSACHYLFYRLASTRGHRIDLGRGKRHGEAGTLKVAATYEFLLDSSCEQIGSALIASGYYEENLSSWRTADLG
jgi:hypothetical protein